MSNIVSSTERESMGGGGGGRGGGAGSGVGREREKRMIKNESDRKCVRVSPAYRGIVLRARARASERERICYSGMCYSLQGQLPAEARP